MPNRQKLYNALKQEGYDNFKDESEFNSYVSDANNRKKLFEALKQEGYDNFENEKSFDEYLGYGEPYTHEYDEQGNLVGGTAYQVSEPYEYKPEVQQRILENKPDMFKPKTVDMYGAHDKEKSELDLMNEGRSYKLSAMRAASTVGEQLDERIKANDEALKKAYAKREKPIFGGSGIGIGRAYSASSLEVGDSEEIKDLKAEQEYLSNAKKVFEAAKNDAGFFQGMKDAVDSSYLSFGMSDLQNAERIANVQQKLEAGQTLSESEQSLLTSLGLQQMVNEQYNDMLGSWYKAGMTTAEMLPFMAEMGANPLSGFGKAAMKASVKKFGEKGAKAIASKILSRTIGDVAGAAGMAATTGLPSVMADALERQQGYVTTGVEGGAIKGTGLEGGETASDAWRKAFTSRTIENWSEMVGEYFSPVGNVIGKGVKKGLGKIGLSKVTDFIDGVQSSNWAKLLDDFSEQTQWNGSLGEFAEEQVGMIADALLVGDTQWSDLVDAEKQLDVALGVGVFGTVMSLLRIGGYRTPKYRARKAAERADNAGKETFGAEQWNIIKASIDNAESDEQMLADLSGVFGSDATEEQKKAAFAYANALKAQQAVNTVKEKQKIDEPGNVAVEAESAYDAGAELQEPQEKHQAKQELDRAEVALGSQSENADEQEFAQMVMNGAGNPVETVNAMAEQGYSDEQIQKAKDYYTAYHRLDGLTDAVMDRVDAAVERADAEVDANINKQSGAVVQVILRDGSTGYVVDHTVVRGEEGSVDVDNSDDTIVVRLETGESKIMNPNKDLLAVSWMESPETLKNANHTVLRKKLLDKEIGEIDWNPATPNPKVGDSFEMDGVPVTIVSHNGKGGMFVVPTEEYQAAAGNEKKMQELAVKAQQTEAVPAKVYKDWASAQIDAQEQAQAAGGENLEGYENSEVGDNAAMPMNEGVGQPEMVQEGAVGENPMAEMGKTVPEKRPMNEDEAATFVSNMGMNAEPIPEIEFTPENWQAAFGEDGTIETPIGTVKMGENQISKLFLKKRTKEFGMIAPTLSNPDIIIEEKSRAKEGKSERESSYLFIKTFIKNGEKVRFYTSVTVLQDGMEVSVSSHVLSEKQVPKKLTEGNVIYIKEALSSNSSDGHLAEQPNAVPDLLPTQEDNASSDNKGNAKNVQEQGNQGDFVAMGAENALKALGEKYGEKMPRKVEVTAKAYAEDLKKAQRKLDKAEDDYDNAPIGREDKAEKARDKARAEFEAVRRESDFWAQLDSEIKAAQVKPGDAVAEEIISMEEPMNGEEFAAQMLANGNIKLLQGSFAEETGFGKEEAKKYFGLFASADNGGLSVSEAGERLMEADRENGTNFFDQNDPNAGRNALIEVLSMAKTRWDLANFIKNNRAEQAKKEQEAEYAAYEAWAEENFHMSVPDYEAYEEVIARDLSERGLSEEDYQEFRSTFVDETLNTVENGQQGIDIESKGGGEVLPDAQSVPTGRASGIEEESAEVDGGVAGTDRAVLEGASGSEIRYDNQGNPIDGQGKLIIEPVNSIDEITDEDFISPTRSVSLPNVPQKVADAIGTGGKPIIIKKNIFEKNKKSHKDLTPVDGRTILAETLFNPNLYGQNQKATRPYNWILIHLADKHSAVIVEVNQGKDFVEIVNWHYLNDATLEQKKNQAIREGGLILTFGNVAGNASDSLASEDKGSNLSEENKGNERNVAENEQYTIEHATYTTKRGKVLDMFLVKPMKGEMSRERQTTARILAKNMRGWYDRNTGGWMLRSKEDAQKFADEVFAVSHSDSYDLITMKNVTDGDVTFSEPVKEDEYSPTWQYVVSVDKETGFTTLRRDDVSGAIPVGDARFTVTATSPQEMLDILRNPMNGMQEVLDAVGVTLENKVKTRTMDAAVKETPKNNPSGNKLVSDERYAELRERMRKKLGGQINMGIDPEILAIGTEMAVYHIEKGARKFVEYAQAMIADLGDAIRPYLKAFYNGARDLPEMRSEGLTSDMTPYEEVSAFDVANFDKPSADVMTAVEAIAKEQEVEQQAEVAKERVKKQRKTREQPKRSVSLSGDLFNSNNVTYDDGRRNREEAGRVPQRNGRAESDGRTAGNQTENVGMGSEAREEGSGTSLRGEAGSVPGHHVSDKTRSGRVHGVSGQSSVKQNARNFSFGEGHIEVPSGDIAKLKANIEAIRTLKEIEASGQPATDAQKKELSKYVGWGGLSAALDADKARFQYDKNWNEKYLSYYKQLKELLTKEEFNDAVQSTNTSHYTPEEVIRGMWKVVEQLGFKGGRINEPAAGVGHILGLMPAPISERSAISGTELDSLSGRIAKALYPDAAIKVQGYETEFAPKSKDLVITNVPFGKTAPYDKALDKSLRKKMGSAYNLHNYFIAKGLLELKEGGIGVFVTSSATMDGANSKFREWAAGNGIDLVGAVRLPNDAFLKNAGTSVTADMLVFRKRKAGEASNGVNFVSTTQIGEGTYQEAGETRTKPIMVNEYFAEHPDMMLGEMMTAHDAGSGGLYSGASQTCVAKKGANLSEELNDAIVRLGSNGVDLSESQDAVGASGKVRTTDLKNGTLVVEGNEVLVSINGELQPIESKKDFTYNGKKQKTADAVRDYNTLKETLKSLIKAEQSATENPEPLRKELNRQYDAFVKKYGTLNRNKALDDVLAEDFEHNLPLSLESVKRVPSATGKSMVWEVKKGEGILSKRVSYPVEEPTKAENVEDAIHISRSYRGVIDIPYVASLTDKTEEEVTDEMLQEGLAYRDPLTGDLADKESYLSGNVKEKLEQARAMAEEHPEYQKNVEDLMEVQPETVRFGDISYRIGTPWIPGRYVNDFASEVLGIRNAEVNYVPSLNEFVIDKSARVDDFAKAGLYNTDRLSVIDLLEYALNQRKPKIIDKRVTYGPTGKAEERIPNEAETQAAAEKIMEISDKFVEYIDGRSDIHRELERIYNDKYNNYRLKQYGLPSFSKMEKNKDGKDELVTHYPNSNREISLREHQAKAVQRALSESTLLAHQVGTGKTFTMITTAMEMRRLGIAKKPMIVVQNATLEDFVKDFYKLYPGANVLAPGKDERSAENRKRLFNLIATGDFDAVVIPQSFMQFIPDDEGRKKELIQKRIDEYEQAIANLEDHSLQRRMQKEIDALRNTLEGKEKKRSVKDKAKAADRIKAKMERQLDRRTDDVLTFEQMGVDALFIDEAHNFKKIGFASKMSNVKGIDTSASQRANSLLLKAQYVQEKNGGRNVILATGTPITNTMAEVWTMMKFVSPDILEDYNIQSFDDFATTFGTVEPSLEFTATGNFKIADRFKSYVNVPELVKAFRSHADVVLTSDVKEFKENNKIPKLKNDRMTNVVIEKNEDLEYVMDVLIKELEAYNGMSGSEKRKWSALPLVVFSRAKQAAIDLRLLNPKYEDNPNSKTNHLVRNVLNLYKESTEDKGTQLVFCDSYQSPGEAPKMDLFDFDPDVPRFNLYEDIKKKLVEGGIPANEIAIVNNYDGERRKQLFEKVRNGDVRVLLGSTEKMGVGVNVQDRLYALHHIDAPNRPMDFEQRNGRILRQGNLYAEWGKPVNVVTYGVQGTLDATAYDRLRVKQDFVNQMMKGDVNGRVMEEQDDEDPSGMTFNQMAATLSGDKTAQILFVAENDLKKLRNLKRSDFNSKSGMGESIQIEERKLVGLNDKLELWGKAKETVKKYFPEGVKDVKVNGQTFTEKLGVSLDPVIENYEEVYSLNRGTAPLKLSLNSGNAEVIVHFDEGRMVYELYAGKEHVVESRQFNGGKGLMSSIEHQLKSTEKNYEEAKQKIAESKKKIQGLEKAMKAPWGREEELKKKEQEVADLKKQLEEKAAENTRGTSAKESDDTLYRSGNLEDVNEEFNKQLDDYVNNGVKSNTIFKLGNPNGAMKLFLPDLPIVMRPRIINKSSNTKHNVNAESLRNLPIMISEPIFVFRKSDNALGVLTEIKDRDGKNVCVAIELNKTIQDGGTMLEVNDIRSIHGRETANLILPIVHNNTLVYADKKKGLTWLSSASYNYQQEIDKKDLDSAAKIVESFENPKVEEENNYRKGEGALTADEVSMANDPIGKILGQSTRTAGERKNFAERERKRMVERVESLAKKLRLNNVDIVTDADTLSGAQRNAKGFYSRSKRKITIVIPNHSSVFDAEQTLLHEAVAHYGLRELFGTQFDVFLDNVYNNAAPEVRERINQLAMKNGWDFPKATEEYLASLAEDTNFDNVEESWWGKIKQLFLQMLHSIGFEGFTGVTLTDNELRYILWRSYENLAEPGKHRSILGEAADIAKQNQLKVGNYSRENYERERERLLNAGRTRSVVAESDEYTYTAEDVIADFEEMVGNHPGMYSVRTEEDIDALPTDRYTKRYIKEKFNNPRLAGTSVYEDDMIVLFPNHVDEVELRETIPHELAHFASRNLKLEESYKMSALDYLRKRFPDSYKKVMEYSKEKWGEEAVAYLFEEKVKELGFERILNGKFDTHNDIGYLFYNITNYLNHGRRNHPLRYGRRTDSQRTDDGRGMGKSQTKNLYGTGELQVQQGTEESVFGNDRGRVDRELGTVPRSSMGAGTESRGQEEVEGDTLYRPADKVEVMADDTARKLYEDAVKTKKYRFQEGFQDAMLSLKKLQEAIVKQHGGKLEEWEDAYTAENQMSSRDTAEVENFTFSYFKPMMKEAANILNRARMDYKSLRTYLIAKSGLERNRDFAVRDALAEREKDGEDVSGLYENYMQRKKELLQDLEDETITFREYCEAMDNEATLIAPDKLGKDYSGLTALFGEDTFTEKAIDEVEIVEGLASTKNLWKSIKRATRFSLDRAKQSGVMSTDAHKKVSEMFEWYVPMRGWNDTKARDVYEYFGGQEGVFNPTVKTAGGRTSLSDDPLATIANMAESAIFQGNKNQMKQKLLNLAFDKPTNLITVMDSWIENKGTEDSPKWEYVYPPIEQDDDADVIAYKIKLFEEEMQQKKDEGRAKKLRGKADVPYIATPKEIAQHIVRVKRNGREFVMIVNGNPRAAQAINGMTNPETYNGIIERMSRQLNQFMAAAFTTKNPTFIVRNLSRDLIFSNTAVAVKENVGYGNQFRRNQMKVLGNIRGLMKRYQSGKLDMDNELDKMFAEFIKNGGETGFAQLTSVDEYKKKIQRELKDAKKGGQVINGRKVGRAVLDTIEFYNRCSEDVSRFTVYMTSRQMGRSIQRSVGDAKEITVNFNKRGSGSKAGGFIGFGAQSMRSLYLFFNAAVQALVNFKRLGKKHPVAFTTALTMYAVSGFLMPVVNEFLSSMLGGDDDDYDNLPEWIRRNNLVFFLGKWRWGGDTVFLTIPLPVEMRAFYGLGEAAYQLTAGNVRGKDAALQITGQFAEMLPLNFVTDAAGPWNAFTPDAFKPIAQAYISNKDWTGKPIYRDNGFNKELPEWTKAYAGTSKWLVDSAELMNELTGGDKYKSGVVDINPARLEHLFTGYFGGFGDMLLGAYKTASMYWHKEYRNVRNIPVLKAFLNQNDERTGYAQVKKDYATFKKEYEDTVRRLNGYNKEMKRPETAMEYAERMTFLHQSKQMKHYVVMRDYERKLSELYKLMRENPDEKAQESIMNTINQVKADAVKRLRSIDEK